MIDIFLKAFSKEVWSIIFPSIWDTVYMTTISLVITSFFGLLFGIALLITDKDGLFPIPIFNRVFGSIINAVLSLPAMVVIILALPISKLIVGISYGPKACIVALTVVCIPIFSRLVENSILEVSKGKIEAVKAMGASNWDIIFKVMIPESLPTLIRNFVVLTITLISVTAIAGSFGAGGLGDIAVRYGYQRFRSDILIASVLTLLVSVELLQFAGASLSRKILKKRHLL
ncbi:MAG: ABC transporter permease [Elusimicrobiota bacterium]|jgi:D-methionine transport system permease protein|nr:ABC transporter permease [Elusimicrobiota bacterium]